MTFPDPPRTPAAVPTSTFVPCDEPGCDEMHLSPGLPPDQMTALEPGEGEPLLTEDYAAPSAPTLYVHQRSGQTVMLVPMADWDALPAQLAQLDQANVTLSGQNTDLAEQVERLRSQVDNCQANAHYRAWQESQAQLAQANAVVEAARALIAAALEDVPVILPSHIEAIYVALAALDQARAPGAVASTETIPDRGAAHV